MFSIARTAGPKVDMNRVVALLWSIWKTQNGTVFRNETPNSRIILIRAKKTSAKRSIKHKFTHFFRSPYPNLPAFTCKKT